MEKKKLKDNKNLCIVIMIVLIIAGLFIGGMSSLNRRYQIISAFSFTNSDVYNVAAAQYNSQLEKFPANVISLVMPVKGPLEYK